MQSETLRNLEKEYFSLAGTVLQCLYHEVNVGGDKFFFFLGYMDYVAEMRLVLEEFRRLNGRS